MCEIRRRRGSDNRIRRAGMRGERQSSRSSRGVKDLRLASVRKFPATAVTAAAAAATAPADTHSHKHRHTHTERLALTLAHTLLLFVPSIQFSLLLRPSARPVIPTDE